MAGKPIKMRRVEKFERARHAGDFWWTIGDAGERTLHVLVPAGDDDTRLGVARVGAYGWHWNGDLDRPTLTPSLRVTDSRGEWRGHVTDGFLVEA